MKISYDNGKTYADLTECPKNKLNWNGPISIKQNSIILVDTVTNGENKEIIGKKEGDFWVFDTESVPIPSISQLKTQENVSDSSESKKIIKLLTVPHKSLKKDLLSELIVVF